MKFGEYNEVSQKRGKLPTVCFLWMWLIRQLHWLRLLRSQARRIWGQLEQKCRAWSQARQSGIQAYRRKSPSSLPVVFHFANLDSLVTRTIDVASKFHVSTIDEVVFLALVFGLSWWGLCTSSSSWSRTEWKTSFDLHTLRNFKLCVIFCLFLYICSIFELSVGQAHFSSLERRKQSCQLVNDRKYISFCVTLSEIHVVETVQVKA